MPVERCFDWESLTLVELAVGNTEAADAYALRAEEDAAQLGLQAPRGAGRSLPRGRAARRRRAGRGGTRRRRSAEAAAAIGAQLHAAFSRSLQGRALAAAGERRRRSRCCARPSASSIRAARCACETRHAVSCAGWEPGPRRAGRQLEETAGSHRLTKRELEIALLATDRKTNREIAAELFLSGKTVESHMRHIFNKLGVSSRVEVARAVEHDAARARSSAADVIAAAPPVDPDAARLEELGYRQELARGLRFSGNAAMGFATISPVVGLYAVVLVGTVVAGPAWVWVLPVALAGQCLLLAVYAELASEFPIAGGAYQWSRRLMGATYGWLSGWVAICAYGAANTTIAYLGAPWALTLAGITPTPNAIVATAMLLVLVCAVVGALGIEMLGRTIKAGIAAEAVASVGIGLALLLVFRTQDFSILTQTLGAEQLSGGSVGAGMLAALAVGGWVFIGFDACVGASEETRGAARHVPRAIWIALLSVAAVVMLNAVRRGARAPEPGRRRRRARRRSGLDRGRHLIRLVVGQAVRRRRPYRVPRLRHGRSSADSTNDLLDRPGRRASGLPLPP